MKIGAWIPLTARKSTGVTIETNKRKASVGQQVLLLPLLFLRPFPEEPLFKTIPDPIPSLLYEENTQKKDTSMRY